jgi:transposase
MLADGRNQREIAERLGMHETNVSDHVRKLRNAILEQAREREDELPAGLLEHVAETLRRGSGGRRPGSADPAS